MGFSACKTVALCGTLVAGFPGQGLAIEDGQLVLPADPGRADDLLVMSRHDLETIPSLS